MTDKEKNVNEELQEEIVTVEPGQEASAVEEAVAQETPVVEESSVEEVKEETDTASSESSSEKIEEEVKETAEESLDNTPSTDEGAEKTAEGELKESGSAEANVTQAPDVNEELAKVQAELEAMREAEEVRQLTVAREQAITSASRQMDDFNNKLAHALEDTLKQYGIDPNMTFEELEQDPAKAQIARDIVVNARRIQAEKQAELIKPITEASNEIIFRAAGKVMSTFNLNEAETKIAAETLINILDATGLANLSEDLKAKVELAVARAKMIAPKVVDAVGDVKEIVKDTKEAVKDVIEEKATKETIEEKAPVVIEEKPSLEAFKEGATADATVSAPVENVTKENVLEVLNKLPHKERAAFFKSHQRQIDEAMREAHKKLGR